MARAIHPLSTTGYGSSAVTTTGHQAYEILHVAYVAAPLLAGLDKFAQLLTHWDKYLAPQIGSVASQVHISPHQFMLGVGVVEIIAALIVAIKPKVGAYIVAAWLVAIIVNLLMLGSYFDVPLRDFGLFLGALALGRLAVAYEGHGESSRHAAATS